MIFVKDLLFNTNDCSSRCILRDGVVVVLLDLYFIIVVWRWSGGGMLYLVVYRHVNKQKEKPKPIIIKNYLMNT